MGSKKGVGAFNGGEMPKNVAKSRGDETEGECQEANGVTGLKSNQLRLA